MTTQTTYAHIISFPETGATALVTDKHEKSITKKGHRTWELDFYIQVFSTEAMSSKDSQGRKHINYSEAIGKTDILKEADGILYAKYGRKFYPIESFVCSYTAQPCIYI